MPYRIHNNDDSIGYYTGQGWDTDAEKATPYATEELAQNIITRHNMDAKVERCYEDDTDSHSGKRKK